MNFNNQNPPFKPILPGHPVQIDLKNATPKECSCGSKYFVPAFLAYTVSALASPNGRELVVQQPVLLCKDCGTPLGMVSGKV